VQDCASDQQVCTLVAAIGQRWTGAELTYGGVCKALYSGSIPLAASEESAGQRG